MILQDAKNGTEMRKSMERKARKGYLDILKVSGTIAIVALHTLSNTLNAGGGYVSETQARIVVTLHQYLYAAVPVFLLATGAGFLATGRENNYKNMAGHIFKAALCIVLFGGLFGGIKILANGEPLSLYGLCCAILANNTWAHMWYLYRLLGLYLFMPLLSAFMNRAGLREASVFCGGVLFFTCLYPNMTGNMGFPAAEVIPAANIWIFYAVAGGILGQSLDKLRKYWWLPAAGTLSGAAGIFWMSAQGAILTEANPFELLFAVSLFAAIRAICGEKPSPSWLAALAKAALGIYIIHPVFIHICVKILRFNPQYYLPALTLPLCVVIFFTCSAALVLLLRKIPLVRRYIL